MMYLKRKKLARLQKKAEQLFLARESNEVSESAIKKERNLYLQMAKIYDKRKVRKTIPHAEQLAIEAYRAAAILGDVEAQYCLAQRFFELGRFWDALGKTCMQSNMQSQYAQTAYKEAHGFVEVAEEAGHSLAKRLRGLAYINGWGVAVDQDAGFKMVVDSIEQEQAWDRATQIFEEIGLNKPEFFATMMSMRKS